MLASCVEPLHLLSAICCLLLCPAAAPLSLVYFSLCLTYRTQGGEWAKTTVLTVSTPKLPEWALRQIHCLCVPPGGQGG